MAITGVNNTDYSNVLLNTGSVDEGNDSDISTADAFKKAVDDLMGKGIENHVSWRCCRTSRTGCIPEIYAEASPRKEY